MFPFNVLEVEAEKSSLRRRHQGRGGKGLAGGWDEGRGAAYFQGRSKE